VRWVSLESQELDNETIRRANKIVLDFFDDAIEVADMKAPITEGVISKGSIYERLVR
jgi:ornithine cyclodeaminase/alanine dehydrogenase-like protein (mu-crystallin family)